MSNRNQDLKERITITIDKDLLEWLDKQIEEIDQYPPSCSDYSGCIKDEKDMFFRKQEFCDPKY